MLASFAPMVSQWLTKTGGTQLIECVDRKRIRLAAFLADGADLTMSFLFDDVSAAAKAKLDEMGPEEAQRLAKDLTKTPRFPL